MNDWISARASLFAEHFALEHTDPFPGEIEYLKRRIADGGEPVLELGCGTGRVLVPLLEGGVGATGIDVSPAMLDRCRVRCAAMGLSVDLHVQSMETLDLPRTFGTVFVASCGLGVLITDDDARATFRKVFAHLDAGGVFSCEIETPPESGPTIDQAGIWRGEWDVTEDGAVLTRRAVHRYDPETHVRPSVMIFERYVDGRLEETEAHETSMRFWEVDVVESLLGEAGFVEVITSKAFTDDEPPGDHSWLAVRARKP